MKVQCDSCKGKKKILGLGMIEHECEKCEGLGRIDESELAEIYIPETIIPESINEKISEFISSPIPSQTQSETKKTSKK